VLDWVGQTGTRVETVMTLLREYADALGRLFARRDRDDDRSLRTTRRRHPRLAADVTLAWPPTSPPPLLMGGIKPRTLPLAEFARVDASEVRPLVD
jgi:hypothetical protein